MTRRFFGTDGIRGQVGTPPMTVDFALRLASAAVRVLAPQGGGAARQKDRSLTSQKSTRLDLGERRFAQV